MAIAKRYTDELGRIKKDIQTDYEYFSRNYQNYYRDKKFAFITSLTEEETAKLEYLGKPPLEFNTIEAYISRLCGEFSKQDPSINVERSADSVSTPLDAATIAVVEGHFRAILADANKDGFSNAIYRDLLGGGFSAIKVWTEYATEMAFHQVIKMKRVFDPTLCYWSVNANQPHKGDASHCGEMYPKTVDDFRNEFGSSINLDTMEFVRSNSIGSFNWSYRTTGNQDVLLVCSHYEKKVREKRIVQLADNTIMTTDDYEEMLQNWNQFKQPPVVKGKSRKTQIPYFCRYQLIQNQVIDYEETDYRRPPIVFVDGNSVMIRSEAQGAAQQVTRSYIWHAKDQQRLINFAGQSLANEMENSVQHKWIIPAESLNPKYLDGITNNQQANAIITNAYSADGTKQLPQPREVVRPPIPGEIISTFSSGAQMMQTILGSYDASLGINNNQLSGVAIVEGATQSNAAAMPYVMGYLQGLNQAALVCLDLIPLYLNTPRSLPIVRPDGKRSYVPINQPGGISLDYESNALNVHIEAGVNFAIQKSRALQQIIALCGASQLFAQFINQMGLEILIDNLEIHGVDQLKQLALQFMQQLKQQQAQAQQMQQQQQAQMAQMPNPLAMKAQSDQAKLQLEQQKFMASQQQAQTDNQFRTAEILNDAQANTNDRLKIMMEQRQAGLSDSVQLAKAKAETYKTEAELVLKADDQQHRQSLEIADMTHQHHKDGMEFAHKVISTQPKIPEDIQDD